jgi:hypothetical protein
MASVSSESGWQVGQERLGVRLQALAENAATVWRRLYYRGDAERIAQLGLLDAVVEPLVFEIGRALESSGPVPSDAWSRTHGLLRLSSGRGEHALDEEFDLLAGVLDGMADQIHARAEERRTMLRGVEAARELAHAELRHLQGGPAPRVRFGGVVVEVFEAGPLRH